MSLSAGPRAERAPWRATVLTLFPEMFPGPLGLSLAGQALNSGVWSLSTRNIRDHGIGRHKTVDDHPAGGGPGMVMRCDVAAAAIDAARAAEPDAPRRSSGSAARGAPHGCLRSHRSWSGWSRRRRRPERGPRRHHRSSRAPVKVVRAVPCRRWKLKRSGGRIKGGAARSRVAAIPPRALGESHASCSAGSPPLPPS